MTGEAERSPHASTPGRDFRAAYATHRASEGRGTDEGELLALPFLTEGRLAGEWRVRCRTFQRFVEVVLEARVRERAPTPITVLDVGAGNGWLSYRVTLKGQRATALDMRTPRELRWSRRNHGKRRGTTGLGGRSDEPALHRVPDEGPAGASLASVRAGLAKGIGSAIRSGTSFGPSRLVSRGAEALHDSIFGKRRCPEGSTGALWSG